MAAVVFNFNTELLSLRESLSPHRVCRERMLYHRHPAIFLQHLTVLLFRRTLNFEDLPKGNLFWFFLMSYV